MRLFRHLALMIALALAISSRAIAAEPFGPEEIEFFEKKVRPILATRCYECHSTAKGKKQGGLLLDARAAILAGGDSGAAAESGEPEKSLLIEAVRYDHAGF